MTVKDRVGRPRYIAFRVTQGAPLQRPALSGALPAQVRLTRFDGTFGIVRTGHLDQGLAVAELNKLVRLGSREVRVETIVASGTIRGAASALPAASPSARRSPAPREGRPAKSSQGPPRS